MLETSCVGSVKPSIFCVPAWRRATAEVKDAALVRQHLRGDHLAHLARCCSVSCSGLRARASSAGMCFAGTTKPTSCRDWITETFTPYTAPRTSRAGPPDMPLLIAPV